MKNALTSTKFWLALLASLIFGLGVSVKAAGNPSLVVSDPESGGQIVGSSVPVNLEVTNFNLVDYKLHPRAVAGQGHVHLWLDQDTYSPTSAIKVVAPSYVFENVAPGQHVLVAELVNNNHTSLVPPVVAVVNFDTTLTAPLVGRTISPLIVSILAFLFLVIVLYFVSPRTKSGSSSGKSPRKSSPKSAKRSR